MDDDRSSARAQRATTNVNHDIAAAVPAAGWREAAPNENQNENPQTKTTNQNENLKRKRRTTNENQNEERERKPSWFSFSLVALAGRSGFYSSACSCVPSAPAAIASASSAASTSSTGVSTSMSRCLYALRPVPAGMSRPMMTFSLSPRR